MKGAIAGKLGVIRPWRSPGSCGRIIPRLRLAHVVPRTDAGRWSGRDPRSEAPGLERVWLRRQSWALLQPVQRHHAWYLSPRVSAAVSISTSRIVSPTISIAPAALVSVGPRPPPAPAAPPPDRGAEAVITRHLRTIVETVVRRAEHDAPAAPARLTPPSPAVARAPAAVPGTPSATPPPQRVLARAARAPTAAVEPGPGRPTEAPEADRASRPARPPPPLPPVQIERITEQVVRALDQRVIAWRERTGRT